jgi:large subunit ribosomal protein L33
MAKEKRAQIQLKCEECGKVNYWTEKNTDNTKEKLSLKKFCRHCRKHTLHNEAKMKKSKKT